MCELYVSHVGGDVEGEMYNNRGRIMEAGGEAGRKGICNVYKTIAGGAGSP